MINAHAVDPEFNGQCAMGMSEGKKQATNCSVFWVGPDDKLYCFFNTILTASAVRIALGPIS